MNGPYFGPREAQPLDLMLKQAGGEGWKGLEALGLPQQHVEAFQPPDIAAMFLAGMARSNEGRIALEWLMDITLRQPLRATGKTIEETALLCAARQGINGVGEAILAAVNHGDQLVARRHGVKS